MNIAAQSSSTPATFIAPLLAFVFSMLLCLPPANGQNSPGYWAGNLSPSAATTQPTATPATYQTLNALRLSASGSAPATLNAMPRRWPIQPTMSGPMPHSGKPFQTASTGPTVSPYLNLFREEEETSEAAPNYFAFVRPQLEQQAANQQQQREIQQLQRQLQTTTATRIVPQYRGPSVPTTSTAARFMDTAQFYGGWQR